METTQATFDPMIRENPMGEARKDALRLDFDRKLKLEFHGTKVISDAGLLAYRELDETLGLTSTIDSELRDIRTGKNTQRGLVALLRQSIYSRLAGYDDTNDAERLCVDPAMRPIAGGRAIERSAASTSVMGRFETEMLTQSKNLERLMNLAGKWIDRVHQRKSRLSCHDFVDNRVRLQLFALAYNLGNSLRRLTLPKSVKKWSLRTLRERLIKIGAKVVSHSRYLIFQMAEVVVPRTLFREILDKIARLRASPGFVGAQ